MEKTDLVAVSLAAVLGVASSFAAEVPPDRFAADGGWIEQTDEETGVYVIANLQRRVPASALRPAVDKIAELLQFRLRIVDFDWKFSLADAGKRLAETKAKGMLFVIDDGAVPAAVLAAPEAGWGVLNVAALSADGAKGRWVEKRAEKELWRAFGYANGGGEADCIMSPASSLAGLDSIRGQAISPGPMCAIEEHLAQRGMKTVLRGTYRHACQQGWAPSPTNDIQRAIWKEIHTPPTKPLKITYDKDRQKPVVK